MVGSHGWGWVVSYTGLDMNASGLITPIAI